MDKPTKKVTYNGKTYEVRAHVAEEIKSILAGYTPLPSPIEKELVVPITTKEPEKKGKKPKRYNR